jgi:peptide/nickel transport system ATP-binding protein/oligopeptide transport system ATP-binding protein
MVESAPVLEVNNLVVAFPTRGSGTFRAVDGASLSLGRGEVLGLVGESGSGKTTLGKTVLRLYRPSAGRILMTGQDITACSERALRPIRRNMQMVFQDPLSSFNPRRSIEEALALPLRLHCIARPKDIPAHVAQLLKRVGLPESFRFRFPHELSGGQLQRVAIARALCLSPALLVADEPVSKLDVSVRAQILNLFRDMQRASGVAMLFITHDLRVARYLCDRIAVMYSGKIVEMGDTEALFTAPQHEYTRALLNADRRGDRAPRGAMEAPSSGNQGTLDCRVAPDLKDSLQ